MNSILSRRSSREVIKPKASLVMAEMNGFMPTTALTLSVQQEGMIVFMAAMETTLSTAAVAMTSSMANKMTIFSGVASGMMSCTAAMAMTTSKVVMETID